MIYATHDDLQIGATARFARFLFSDELQLALVSAMNDRAPALGGSFFKANRQIGV